MIAIILPTLLGIASTSASEIRDFDLKTIEFLGRHLYEYQNQTAKSLSNREANAIEATKTALNHRIDKSYKLIVLHDPTKSGYLVYALATSKDPNDVVLGIHYRVSVSANSNSVERVDALSRSRVVVNKMEAHALWMIQLVSRTPVETHVYLSLLHSKPLYVGTPDHAIWKIQDGRISLTRRAR